MPYHVRVSSMIEFWRIGSLILLTQSQFVTGSRTTSPLSHNPGQAVRPLLANSSLLGSIYRGSRPVTRSAKSGTTTRAATTNEPTFSALDILVLPGFVTHPRIRKTDRQNSPESHTPISIELSERERQIAAADAAQGAGRA